MSLQPLCITPEVADFSAWPDMTAETAPETAPEPPAAPAAPSALDSRPQPAREPPSQAVVLHLLQPPHDGQLMVAALYAATLCGSPMQVVWQDHTYEAYSVKDGWSHVLLPISVTTRPGDYPLAVRCGTSTAAYTVPVGAATYPESRLQEAPKFTGRPPPRVGQERQLIDTSLRGSSCSRLWDKAFTRPTNGQTTSPFGVRRTFNGKLKSRHLGEDFDGRVGAGVWAANDGVVVLAAADFFYTGNAVFIDHGQQLFTMYFHMTKLDVRSGDKVVRGQRLGSLGSTGRVTGPHLHFGVKLAGTYINPADLLAYEPSLPLGRL